ncbi:PadR family transcriptional regulator [Streptomyces griseus]|uniref:PadR family transcriptional regulator n=1 Tax=Streptomyces griseus TaxID=1911 RepID=UPI00364A71D5
MVHRPIRTGDDMPDDEPTAEPLPRLGRRAQAVLGLLLEDPSREVWPYWLDQQPATRGGDNYQVLKRLAGAGWLSRREETGKPNARVLYRLTPAGEARAREALQRPDALRPRGAG